MALQSFSKLFGGDSESMQMIRSNIEFDRLQFVCVCVSGRVYQLFTLSSIPISTRNGKIWKSYYNGIGTSNQLEYTCH